LLFKKEKYERENPGKRKRIRIRNNYIHVNIIIFSRNSIIFQFTSYHIF